jgi:hypothetical protein
LLSESTRSRQDKREANHRGKGSVKKVLKKQSDAIATKGTKAKMAPAGMAMYQCTSRDRGNSRLSLRPQTKEISLIAASFFHSCNIPAHNSNAAIYREMVRAIKMAPASYAPPPPQITPRSMNCCGEAFYDVVQFGCSTECKTSHSLVGHFVQME